MTPDEAAAFGYRLRELRERAGLTQTKLAERAAMHRQGIVKLERGEREPAWSTLLALAKALDVDLNAFAQRPVAPGPPRGPGRPPKRPRAALPPGEQLQGAEEMPRARRRKGRKPPKK